MTVTDPVSPDAIRAMFASALSSMYRREVPQYGTLLKLVSDINHQNINPSNLVSRLNAMELSDLEHQKN
ncbi:hypothetical protein ACKAV7_003233 [Fusarium commune]